VLGVWTEVEDSYQGARLEGDNITLEFVKKMMDDFKNQHSVHKRYAFQILLQTRELLLSSPTLVDITIPDHGHFTVCGDIHGQVYSADSSWQCSLAVLFLFKYSKICGNMV
jgi:serine/threonine-protein phosphatase 5